MPNFFKFSLIVTSVDRADQFDAFLQSLRAQDLLGATFEIVFVDQSGDLFNELIKKYADLDIIHIHTKKISLSAARNIGIKYSSGNVLAFPDDDCLYYPDTLSMAVLAFLNSGGKVVIGQIYDRIAFKPIIKKWPNVKKFLTKYDVMSCASSITIFTKYKYFFDERMGVGAEYGACEDNDILYAYIKSGMVIYDPDVQVWHPDYKLEDVSVNKSFNYGRGFGFFYFKHFDFYWGLHFLLACGYSSFKMLMAAMRLDLNGAKNRLYFILGRISGLINH